MKISLATRVPRMDVSFFEMLFIKSYKKVILESIF